MDCKQFNEIISGNHSGESEADSRQLLEEHALHCPECALELLQHNKVESTLKSSLEKCCAPEHLRARILSEAFGEKARSPGNTSERLRRTYELPLRQRVFTQLRRSPYFAASLVLHGVAAAIIIALLLTHSANEPSGKQVVNSGGQVREYVFDFTPNSDATKAIGETVEASYSKQGVTIHSAKFLASRTFRLAGDPTRGCIEANNPAEASTGELVHVATDGKLVIPAHLVETARLGQSGKIRIVQVTADSLEFWPLSRWEEYRANKNLNS